MIHVCLLLIYSLKSKKQKDGYPDRRFFQQIYLFNYFNISQTKEPLKEESINNKPRMLYNSNPCCNLAAEKHNYAIIR